MRAAALPVGAATAMRSLRVASSSSSSANVKTSVCVLPVPGPPVMTQIFFRAAASAAMDCKSISEPDFAGNSDLIFSASNGSLRFSGAALARRKISAASVCSYSQ